MANQWFDDQQKKNPVGRPPKEDKEILDEKELRIHYDDLKRKLQLHTNESYIAIGPTVQKLMGDINSSRASGDITELKVQLRETRMVNRLDIGRKMWDTIEAFEYVYGWQTRYMTQLEDFEQSTMDIVDNAFKIIRILKIEIDAQKLKIQNLENGLIPEQIQQQQIQEEPEEEKEYQEPLDEKEIARVRVMFDKSFKQYIEEYSKGAPAYFAKGMIFKLSYKNEEKKKLLHQWFDEEMTAHGYILENDKWVKSDEP